MTDSLDTTFGHELVAEGVVVVRGGRTILREVSMTVEPGQVLAVTGPSGAGKSTLLSLLAGLAAPDQGRVLFGGEPVRAGDDAHLRRTGLVLQGYGLVSVLTAAENVELVLQCRGVATAEVRARAAAMLERVGLGEQADHLIEELSGGQQQRVAVARALVDRPDLLIADEPTAELDAGTRDLIIQLLREEAWRGATVVVATHDPDVTEKCDDEIHLVDGEVSTASTV
jgi:putative ABC transport system ATP-binding protein